MKIEERFLISASLIHLLNHVFLYAFPSVVLFVREDISLSYPEIGVLGTIPSILMVILSPFAGRTKPGFEVHIIVSGLLIMSFSLLLMSFAQNFMGIAVAVFILGIGAAAYHPPAFSVVSMLYETRKAEGLSLNQGAGAFGTGLAPFLLTISAGLIGWRGTLFFASLTGLLTVPFSIILFIGTPIVIRNLSIKPVVNGKPDHIVQKDYSFIALLSGILLFVLFLSTFRATIFRTVCFFSVTLMKDFYGMSKFESGLITSVLLLLGAIMGFVGGKISDSRENGRIQVLLVSGGGTVIFSLLIISFTSAPQLFGIFLYSGFVLIYFIGGSSFAALLAEAVPKEQRTTAFGLNFSIGQTAGAFAPAIFGGLLDISMTAAMAYLFIVSCGSVILVFILNRRSDLRNNEPLSPLY
ncbi:MAG: MFS transporter [Promethearchaeota archaeon]